MLCFYAVGEGRMTELWAESCPVCQAELATVRMSTDDGEIQIGPKCSRLLEQLARLMGITPKRRAALRTLK